MKHEADTWHWKNEHKSLFSPIYYYLMLELRKRLSCNVTHQGDFITDNPVILEFCVCYLISRWWWCNCQRHRKETKTSGTKNLQTADFSTCSGAFSSSFRKWVVIFMKYAFQECRGNLLNISFSIIWSSKVTKECL